MVKIKEWIRRYGGEKLQSAIVWFLLKFKINNKIILYSAEKAMPNRVNLNYWSEVKNLGDAISPVIVNYVAKRNNIDVNKSVSKTKHLYAVGSVITAGCQDCTVWGSGILNAKILWRLKNRVFDVRSVRGPITRMILMEYGHQVPEIYGDPAIIMPLIYNPNVEKKYKVSVISHGDEDVYENYHQISIITDDYKQFIEEIKASELIVSSSLHGIIFAEAFGVPAILLQPRMDVLKYFDYYYSTERYTFPIARSMEEALNTAPPPIPDFTKMRENVLATFPTDLWE